MLVSNINPYLLNAPNILIWSRSKPVCNVPKMTKGNQPTDGGNLILSKKEMEFMIKEDPSIADCIKRYVGSKDYINNTEPRYCLWLKDVSPVVYKHNTEILRRLDAVRQMRLSSSAEPTRKSAETPFKFFSTPQTKETYLIIPRVSSERRKYIPIGFMTPDIIAADSCSIIPNANLYHFGVLTSNVHNAWMRIVAGRLESRYRYSGSVVYNNFPWCELTPEQKTRIEKTAQAILDARALYPDCSLADMYGEHMYLYPELLKAHQENDKAVMAAYGFTKKAEDGRTVWLSESETVAELFKMYEKLVKEK